MENYTEELAEIMQSSAEREAVSEIIAAWGSYGLPASFEPRGVKFAFNRESGYVFLVNDDCQVAMLNGEKLDMFHFTPYDGHEGFIVDLLEEFVPHQLNEEDEKYIRNVADFEGHTLPEAWRVEK
jgi:hypothetical protein